MKLFVISQNLTKSGLKLPSHAILRINLAWCKNFDSIKAMLDEYSHRHIFLDIPIGRKKPPNYNHDIDEIAKIANAYVNVKYVAISNVEEASLIHYYCKKFNSKIVPKIETYRGTVNLSYIIDALNYKPPIIMLDHEDLFSNLVSLKKEAGYLDIVDRIRQICKRKKTELLRAQGIIFSNV